MPLFYQVFRGQIASFFIINPNVADIRVPCINVHLWDLVAFFDILYHIAVYAHQNTAVHSPGLETLCDL